MGRSPKKTRRRRRIGESGGGAADATGGNIGLKLAAALIRTGLASDWRDALLMPAGIAMALLDQMSGDEPEAKPAATSGARVEEMFDGSKKISFSSLKDLSAALKGSGWNGV